MTYTIKASPRNPNAAEITDSDGRRYTLINPDDHDTYFAGSRYHRGAGLIGLWFDQHAPIHLLVWARGLEDALEECAGWLMDNGLKGVFATFSDDDRAAARREIADDTESSPPTTAEEISDEAVQEHLEVDHTYTETGLIPSEDWGDDFSPEGHPAPDDLVKAAVDYGRARFHWVDGPCCEGMRRIEAKAGDAGSLVGWDCDTHGVTLMPR
jgi:hypothetical protein